MTDFLGVPVETASSLLSVILSEGDIIVPHCKNITHFTVAYSDGSISLCMPVDKDRFPDWKCAMSDYKQYNTLNNHQNCLIQNHPPMGSFDITYCECPENYRGQVPENLQSILGYLRIYTYFPVQKEAGLDPIQQRELYQNYYRCPGCANNHKGHKFLIVKL